MSENGNTLKRLAPFRVGHVSCHHDVDGGSQELSLLLEVRLGKQWSELRRTIQEYFVEFLGKVARCFTAVETGAHVRRLHSFLHR